MILLDTNILLRFKNPNAREHSEIVDRLFQWTSNSVKLVIAPQVLFEFYVVATRPVQENGFGLSPLDSKTELDNLCDIFELLPEKGETFRFWYDLVVNYQVKGKKSHDKRLIAFMKSYDIKKLYTFNKSDFHAFSKEIELV